MATAWHELTCDASLAQALVIGIAYDAAAAAFAAFPWLLLGVLAPVRLLKSLPGKILIASFMTVFIGILIFIATAEWFFWDEFSARFNFIAVDYLIFTPEVIGNIKESYPMIPILSGIVTIAGMLAWQMSRKRWFIWAIGGITCWKDRCAWLITGLAVYSLVVAFVKQSSIPVFANQFHTEIAKNGCWSFLAAGKLMELEYDKWYAKLPLDEALVEAKQQLVTADEPATSQVPNDLRRSLKGRGTEHPWNVIVVCMESMSGDYMGHNGNNAGITPNLDRLSKESVFFENLYATGTRTVRGIEALTLNLPPTPGQSIIYRPEGINLITTFTPFLARGYDCAFLYGGNGRFDYMNRYFSTSGCRIMDIKAWEKNDVTFKTSWGACDEDLFRKTLAEADADHAAGRPFHFFCMTTSNHRPYDFPEGHIDMHSHDRKSAVKYADWAVGNLIEQASKRPWFNDTLFVIVADHCASSAGKSEIDVTKYHIPAMIYNPALVPAKMVSTLCSQIDIMPTVFGLLNWNYQTLGYGHDLLAPSAGTLPGRTFVSNYQKIALLRDEGIAILKPNRKHSSYTCNMITGDFSPIDRIASDKLVHDATVFYQSASWLFSTGKLKKNPPAPSPSNN